MKQSPPKLDVRCYYTISHSPVKTLGLGHLTELKRGVASLEFLGSLVKFV